MTRTLRNLPLFAAPLTSVSAAAEAVGHGWKRHVYGPRLGTANRYAEPGGADAKGFQHGAVVAQRGPQDRSRGRLRRRHAPRVLSFTEVTDAK